jgi:tRNA(fMet)-specific endonuclease VapC
VARRLILDTGVLVASERAQDSWGDLLRPDDDVALAAVTVAELRTGVELASASRREAREAFLVHVLRAIPVENYNLAVAQVHGRLLAIVHRKLEPAASSVSGVSCI